MIQCPTCKQMLENGVRFCPHDGTPLTETASVTGVKTPTGTQPKSKELELPLVIGERYRLVEARGGGGMAKVYRAVDLTLEREVAVKLINPELRTEPEFDARFQREARIASQLSDPHIVVVHDFGIDATHGPFLVMEYLQGQSLRERLLSGGPLPLKACLQLSAQLFLALIHAHEKNIVHRDIKPDNIFLLNQSGVRLHVRILDFGIARIYRRDDPEKHQTLTNPGAVLGTPRYMSPEQLAGQPVDARSDIFSAALVIHESLTGQLPYVTSQKLCELCPEATSALQDLLDQCLKPNPAERPPSAVEVYLRLQELGKASGILLLPPGAMDKLIAARQAQEPTVAYVPKGPAPPTKRRQILIGLAVVLTVALVGGGLWLLKHLLSSPPAVSGQETLLGVKIGDSKAEVGKRLSLTTVGSFNPWKGKRLPAYLAHTLREADLGLDPDALDHLEVRLSEDQKVCGLFHNDHLIALVVQGHGASTGRGLKIGHDLNHIYDLYDSKEDSPPETERVLLEDEVARANLIPPGAAPNLWSFSNPKEGKGVKKRVDVHRHPKLGIGFEIRDGKVAAITLYPPVKGP
jgi:tRNA A-37 threonylcarbamoyl transferase component Bud32